jgi:hypothetical protein
MEKTDPFRLKKTFTQPEIEGHQVMGVNPKKPKKRVFWPADLHGFEELRALEPL